jgi:hypothetical protein
MELDPKKHVGDTKQFRKDLDEVLQRLKAANGQGPKGGWEIRTSRERSLAITKVQEAIMWLGMDLKAMHEQGVPGTENPYPESYNPESPKIEPTADGIKL